MVGTLQALEVSARCTSVHQRLQHIPTSAETFMRARRAKMMTLWVPPGRLKNDDLARGWGVGAPPGRLTTHLRQHSYARATTGD
jgi:hypothetical protein